MWVRTVVIVMGLAASLALTSGCIEDVRFNPSGCEVQVRGQWFVNGENPDEETCGNIALVELAIINEDETEFWAAPEFLLRCDAASDSNAVVIDGGAFLDTTIVTRGRCGGTGEILEFQNEPYRYRWRSTTDQNFIVDCSPINSQPITTIDGGTTLILDLPPVDFITQEPGIECPITSME
ncbi:MAG: hypothetical protein AAGF92_19745 [Myxococcota bacterium]